MFPDVTVYALVVPGKKEVETATVPEASVLVAAANTLNVTEPIATPVDAVGALERVMLLPLTIVTVVFAGMFGPVTI